MSDASHDGWVPPAPVRAVTRRRLLLAALTVALLVAAGAAYGRIIPRIPGRAAPAPEATWGAAATVLAAGGTVAGLHLETVTEFSYNLYDRITVYGSPHGDPFAGPTLLAIYQQGSDVGGLPRGPGEPRRVWVNGHRAELYRDGADVWINWSVWFDDDQERDEYGVRGYQLSEAEVLGAARHLVGGAGRTPRISAGGVPEDLTPLAGGAASIGGSEPVGTGTRLTWTGKRQSLSVISVGADQPTGILARALIRGPATAVRGAPGTSGPAGWNRRHGSAEIGRAWVADGTAYLVTAYGLSAAELDQVVAELRPVDAAGLAELRRAAADYPLENRVPAGQEFVAGGRLGSGYWLVTRSPGARPQISVTVRLPEDGDLSSTHSAPARRASPLETTRHQSNSTGALVGAARAPVDSVRVTLPDGTVTAVILAPVTPEGYRWFGVLLPDPGPVTVVGYDATGAEVSRLSR